MRKQYSTIIIGILFLVGCAGVQVASAVMGVHTPNTSAELRKIVVSNEATVEQDGIQRLGLYVSKGSIIHRVIIFVKGTEVLVRYIYKADGHTLTCYLIDEQCDGKLDRWRVIADGLFGEAKLEEIQDYYDTHIIRLVRFILKNGKTNKGEPVKWVG